MDAASDTDRVDPDALARLVLHCRDFHSYLDELVALLPARDQTPFLYKQLDTEVEALKEGLEKIGRSATERETNSTRKGSLLGRILGRSKSEGFDSKYDFEGNAWTIPVAELVGFLATSARTGVLSVNSKTENFVIELRNGRLVRATTDRTPPGFRVGELLVKQGALRSDEVDELVAEAKRKKTSFGLHLLNTGRVSDDELKTALATQVQGLFYRLVGTRNSFYRFQEGVDLSNTKALEMNVMSLLLESARFHDEMGNDAADGEQDVAIEAARVAAETTLVEESPMTASEMLASLEAEARQALSGVARGDAVRSEAYEGDDEDDAAEANERPRIRVARKRRDRRRRPRRKGSNGRRMVDGWDDESAA